MKWTPHHAVLWLSMCVCKFTYPVDSLYTEFGSKISKCQYFEINGNKGSLAESTTVKTHTIGFDSTGDVVNLFMPLSPLYLIGRVCLVITMNDSDCEYIYLFSTSSLTQLIIVFHLQSYGKTKRRVELNYKV